MKILKEDYKRKKTLRRGIWGLATLFILGIPFFAIANNGVLIGEGQDVIDVIINLTEFVWRIFLLITVLVFIYAGFTYYTAAGNPDKFTTANKMVMYGLIGLAVALLGWGVSSLMKDFLDPDYYNYLFNFFS